MSLNLTKLKTVAVFDPRINADKMSRQYAILKGGKEVNSLYVATTDVSSSNINFNIKPPSPNTFVSRKVYIRLPVRLEFTSSTPVVGQNLLQNGFFAPRCFPIHNSCKNMSVGLNGDSASFEPSDVIQALLRYNICDELRDGSYSTTPSYLDQSQRYQDLNGSIRSPMALYTDAVGNNVGGRAGFPMKIIVNTTSRCVIDMVITEQILLPPFYSGGGMGGAGFIGLQAMDFNFNFVNNVANRMFSFDQSGAFGAIDGFKHGFNNFTTIDGAPFTYERVQTPQMIMEYITPRLLQKIPPSLEYPYFKIQKYLTSVDTIANNGSSKEITNNIVFNSIPRRIYIFAKRKNADLEATPYLTDTFFGIKSISINFGNRAGILSQAPLEKLYEISRRNGCNMNFQSWSNQYMNTANVAAGGPQFAGAGTIICLQPSTDFGLQDDQAEGLLGNWNFSAQVEIRNRSGVNADCDLYVVTVSEGVCTITNGQAQLSVGVISPADILNSEKNISYTVDYNDIMDVKGGNFFSGIKNFGENLYNMIKSGWKGIQKLAPHIQKGYEVAQKIAPSLIGEGMRKRKKRKAPAKRRRRKGGILTIAGSGFSGGELVPENYDFSSEDYDSDEDYDSEEEYGGRIIPKKEIRKRIPFNDLLAQRLR